MRNIRIGLCLLIFFGSSYYTAAQKEKNDFSALINTDLSVFKKEVIANTGLFTENDWNTLYSKAQENIFDGNYQKASDYAAKSQILAEAIGNHLLNAKSYRLSGEINLNKEKIPEAISDFHLSQDTLFNADKAPQDLVAAEYARLILDVVETQATDRLFNSQEELDKAFLNVGTVIKFCDQHPDNEVFNDIKTSALIKQAGIMEMEEHYPAEIVLLDHGGDVRGLIRPSNIDGVDLLPADDCLRSLDVAFHDLDKRKRLAKIVGRAGARLSTDPHRLPARADRHVGPDPARRRSGRRAGDPLGAVATLARRDQGLCRGQEGAEGDARSGLLDGRPAPRHPPDGARRGTRAGRRSRWPAPTRG